MFTGHATFSERETRKGTNYFYVLLGHVGSISSHFAVLFVEDSLLQLWLSSELQHQELLWAVQWRWKMHLNLSKYFLSKCRSSIESFAESDWTWSKFVSFNRGTHPWLIFSFWDLVFLQSVPIKHKLSTCIKVF